MIKYYTMRLSRFGGATKIIELFSYRVYTRLLSSEKFQYSSRHNMAVIIIIYRTQYLLRRIRTTRNELFGICGPHRSIYSNINRFYVFYTIFCSWNYNSSVTQSMLCSKIIVFYLHDIIDNTKHGYPVERVLLRRHNMTRTELGNANLFEHNVRQIWNKILWCYISTILLSFR